MILPFLPSAPSALCAVHYNVSLTPVPRSDPSMCESAAEFCTATPPPPSQVSFLPLKVAGTRRSQDDLRTISESTIKSGHDHDHSDMTTHDTVPPLPCTGQALAGVGHQHRSFYASHP